MNIQKKNTSCMLKNYLPVLYFIASLIVLAVLKYFHPLTPVYELLIVYFITLAFPKFKIEIIGLASIFYFIFFMTDYQTFKYGTLVHTYAEKLEITEKLFSLILFLCIFWILKRVILYLNQSIKWNSSFLGILTIPLVGAATYEGLRLFDLPINHFLLPVLIAKSVWFFILYLKYNEKNQSLKDQTLNLAHLLPPFFFQRYEARENYSLKNYQCKDTSESAQQAKIGFWFVLRGVVTIIGFEYSGQIYAQWLCKSIAIDSYGFPYFNDFFLNLNTLYLKLSWYQLWLVLIFSCVDFLFTSYYGYYSLFIGFCRLFGFKMNSPTNRPWKAQSFGDFCWRFMYFYSFILMNYFYIPFLNLFSKFKLNPPLRKNICLFLTIAIGGFYFHFINDYFFAYDKGYLKTFIYYFKNYMPLFSLWAFVIVFNTSIKYRMKYQWISFPTYILMYTLISTFRLLFKFNSLGDFLAMYAKMFNLH